MMKIKDFRLVSFSNPYYDFLDNFAQSEYESAKLLGKFYTDYTVAEEMIDRVVAELEQHNETESIRIIDPFCGDGRLIIKLLQVMAERKVKKSEILYIYLWDVDESAVKSAEKAVRETAAQYNFNARVTAEKTDTFVSCFEVEGTFDVCVTNPPWGLLKPLKLFNSRCNEEELETYKVSIAGYDDYMRQEYLVSQPTSKFGRWGTNLGRCGLEVALRLISSTGVCGFVSPASLFNDQVSARFRKWIFEKYNMSSVSYFPAELKLYGSADVSSITAVARVGITEQIKIRIYDLDFKAAENMLQGAGLQFIKSNGYLIPLESGIHSLRLQMQWDALDTLEEFCISNGLRFVREMDESRWEEKVCNTGNYIFAKGYMVNKFSFEKEDLYINESVVEIPKTASNIKLVWRDVSRNSQKRRVKATILPENCVVGNSLGAIYSETNNIWLLNGLLGIINSYVFEFQARKQLVSNHVPAGVLKKIKIPWVCSDSPIVELVSRRMNGELIDSEIEVCVAKMYGLNMEEFVGIVRTFNEEEKEVEILTQVWNSQERI